MLRIVPHTAPRVGRSHDHFLDGFELHLLTPGRQESVQAGTARGQEGSGGEESPWARPKSQGLPPLPTSIQTWTRAYSQPFERKRGPPRVTSP